MFHLTSIWTGSVPCGPFLLSRPENQPAWRPWTVLSESWLRSQDALMKPPPMQNPSYILTQTKRSLCLFVPVNILSLWHLDWKWTGYSPIPKTNILTKTYGANVVCDIWSPYTYSGPQMWHLYHVPVAFLLDTRQKKRAIKSGSWKRNENEYSIILVLMFWYVIARHMINFTSHFRRQGRLGRWCPPRFWKKIFHSQRCGR